jgi:hypothetical protein
MVGELIPLSWVWLPPASALVAVCGFFVAIFAFIRSGQAVRASVPGPEVRTATPGFTVVRMRQCDEHQFAISRLEARNANFLVVADIKLTAIPDILRGYLPLGKRVRSMTFNPPAVSLIIRTTSSHENIRVCVICRQDPEIRRWIDIPI